MKNLFCLFVFVLTLNSCQSDNDDASANFTSTIVINGESFTPDNGTVRVGQASLPLQQAVRFILQKGDGTNGVLVMDIFFPMGRTPISGTYSFGPGTAEDLLFSADFNKGSAPFAIEGESVTVTDLGNSRYRFEFHNAFALDPLNNFEQTDFSGTVEGTLTVI